MGSLDCLKPDIHSEEQRGDRCMGFSLTACCLQVFKFRPSLGNDAAYTELSQLTADMFMGQSKL